MSEPRRKRRRRRGGTARSAVGTGRATAGATRTGQPKQVGQGAPRASGARRRRRRGGRARPEPVTLEQIVASYRTPSGVPLTREPDGQDVDEIIRELQSHYGVPLYPQEYRITIKVPEDKNGKAAPRVEPDKGEEPRRGPTGAVREKAPAAPRVTLEPEGATEEEGKPKRRRRRRRRRGGGGGTASA